MQALLLPGVVLLVIILRRPFLLLRLAFAVIAGIVVNGRSVVAPSQTLASGQLIIHTTNMFFIRRKIVNNPPARRENCQ